MGSRCDWHLGDLGLPDDTDPLQEIAQLQSEGELIDLAATEEDLIARLDALMDREGRFAQYAVDDDGVSPLLCNLKHSDQHVLTEKGGALSCFNCPHYTAEPGSAKALICSIGREQETILEQYRAIALADSLEDELIRAYASELEHDAELAEACLVTA